MVTIMVKTILINKNDESGNGPVNVVVNGKCNHADYTVEYSWRTGNNGKPEKDGFVATCTKCNCYRYNDEPKWYGISILPIGFDGRVC